MKLKSWIIILVAVIGLLDASYLTLEHFQQSLPPCTDNILLGDCGKVLDSQYSVILGVPLALIGVIHYSVFTLALILGLGLKNRWARLLSFILSFVGFLSSLYFVFLQLFVIGAICFFCMVSAVTSTILFILAQVVFKEERQIIGIWGMKYMYQYIMKPMFFRLNPETVHDTMTHRGEAMGRLSAVKTIFSTVLSYKNPMLVSEVGGVVFDNPIGLAAGFDYEARLTQILPSLGFGFQSVGTITNKSYKGNTRPMLGRLPKSKSLMVNKGFKNFGAVKTIEKLKNLSFEIPVGISIGRTNTTDLVTQKQSIEDILRTFTLFESSTVPFSYYELNISCPNLHGNISFYPKRNLQDLLKEIDRLELNRPVFIKMPIELENKHILEMLDVIAWHSPTGVIFGNLQKDRHNPLLDRVEVSKFPVGNFSGKPTFDRSNELIRLTYKHHKDRLHIIGCGGVFNAADAYEKITSGASLVQIITGMIYQGPQLIAEINMGLVELLKKDGFTHISQAVGSRRA